MKFDQHVNKLLEEAHFGSPYEKATGIKKQITQFFAENEQSEFRETKNRKLQAMHIATLRAILDWDAEGSPMGKAGATILVDRFFHHMLAHPDEGLIQGDQMTDDDYPRALLALGHATGVKGPELGASLKIYQKKKFGPKTPEGEEGEIDMKPAMSLTRVAGIEKDARKKVGADLGALKKKDSADIEDDPNKIASARQALAKSLASSRKRETYR